MFERGRHMEGDMMVVRQCIGVMSRGAEVDDFIAFCRPGEPCLNLIGP